MANIVSTKESVKHGASISKPHSRISWGSQLSTISGFDRLKIGLYVDFKSEKFIDILDIHKTSAVENNSPVDVSFSPHGDQVFLMHTTGRKGGYAYHFSRGDVHVFVSRRKDFTTPNVWVDIGSESCWSPSYDSVLDGVKSLLHDYDGDVIKDTVSEVHLCCDVVGQDIEELPIDNGRYWITRATKFSAYFDRDNLEGVQLMQDQGTLVEPEDKREFPHTEGVQVGKGDILLRIYDKVLELKKNKSKQGLFAALWNQSEFDNTPITRIEFQLRRQVLKQMSINSLADLETKKCGLWSYCSKEWARLSLFDIDRRNRHQDRAVIHPFWEYVQEVDFSVKYEPVVREHKRTNKDWEYLSEMAAGYGMSIGVLLERKCDDLEGTIAFAQGAIESGMRRLWDRRGPQDKFNEFQKRMKKRWADIWPMGFEPRPG